MFTKDNKQQNENDKKSSKKQHEPELIEITDSDDEPSNSLAKKTSKIELNSNEYSYEPWNICVKDLDRPQLDDKKVLKDELKLDIEIIRYGTIEFQSGEAIFVSTEKGIKLNTSCNDDKILLTIAKEDLEYCAACFINNINVIFIQPNRLFIDLFKDKMQQFYSEHKDLKYDPKSKIEKYRKIIILFKSNKKAKQIYLQLNNYFELIKSKNKQMQIDYITYKKARELLIQSLGEKSQYLIDKRIVFNDESDSLKVIAKYQFEEQLNKRTIELTFGDLERLEPAEFLNDNIISFYLNYIYNEILSEYDQKRTHIFDSYFYQRLTQKDQLNQQRHTNDTNNEKSSASERRHARVKKWTRNINIFEKDFLIMPINKNHHWYLAIICYPGLREPVYTNEFINLQEQLEEEESNKNEQKSLENDQLISNDNESFDEATSSNDEITHEIPVPSKENRVISKMPTILIFDSLAGLNRGRVVVTIREYLQYEWNTKYQGIDRQFTKENFRGIQIKVPSQNNFYDCGIYLLQYVESFFTNPIRRYNVPLNLNKWFDSNIIENKRNDIKKLILDLSKQQQLSNDPAENPLKSKFNDENDKPNKNKKQKLETESTGTILDVVIKSTSNNQINENNKKLTQNSISTKIIDDLVKL